MKLMSIRVNNVRRFTQPVEVAGIGPGLNVLAAPNEMGKSTLFDALHALFFFEAKSWKQKEAVGLAPHAGGNPEVSAEIALDGQTYRLSKVFSSKPGQRQVTVHRDGHLIKQAEEAEAWIRALIKPPKDGGPAGLLWVRQGLTTLQPGKEDETLTARRDVLSSVAGEIEDITGGRQMDKIRARVTDALDTYLTRTGATRKHGPLWEAEQSVADLEQQRADLQDKAEKLRGMLLERRNLRKEQAGLTDPDAQAERLQALDCALANQKAAKAYLAQQEQADTACQTARLVLDTHKTRIETAQKQLNEVHDARSALAQVQTQLSDAETRLATAQKQLEHAQTAEQSARERQAEAERIRDAVVIADAGRDGAARRRDLSARLDEARQLAKTAAEARKVIASSPSAADMERLEQAWQELELAQRARDASAAAITLTAEPGQQDKVTLDGTPLLSGQRRALPRGGEIAIAGIGTIHVHPAQQRDESTVDRAQAAFDDARAATGCPSLTTARQAAKTRASAENTLRDATAQLKILAPDGIPALMNEIDGLPDPVAEDDSLPSRAEADSAYRSARDNHGKAQAQLEGMRTAHDALHGDMRVLRGRLDEVKNRLDRALAVVGDPDATAQELSERIAKLPDLETTLEEAERHARHLAENAPDLAMARAAAQRAQNVVDQTDSRLREIDNRLSALEALITHEAALSVEEKLTEIDGQLDSARRLAAQIGAEVKVLQRLDTALSEAQAQAHDAYIGPIRTELRPLLGMVLPGAELMLDADSVLPTGLSRPEGEDSYDQLSGGTQEQIALLVRLAFARLLAKSGTPAPIILDDAIVYTDDDRIERMFNALTQQAGDMQIIVLSCRQKVFRGLGGQTLSIRPAQAVAGA